MHESMTQWALLSTNMYQRRNKIKTDLLSQETTHQNYYTMSNLPSDTISAIKNNHMLCNLQCQKTLCNQFCLTEASYLLQVLEKHQKSNLEMKVHAPTCQSYLFAVPISSTLVQSFCIQLPLIVMWQQPQNLPVTIQFQSCGFWRSCYCCCISVTPSFWYNLPNH